MFLSVSLLTTPKRSLSRHDTPETLGEQVVLCHLTPPSGMSLIVLCTSLAQGSEAQQCGIFESSDDVTRHSGGVGCTFYLHSSLLTQRPICDLRDSQLAENKSQFCVFLLYHFTMSDSKPGSVEKIFPQVSQYESPPYRSMVSSMQKRNPNLANLEKVLTQGPSSEDGRAAVIEFHDTHLSETPFP